MPKIDGQIRGNGKLITSLFCARVKNALDIKNKDFTKL